MPRKEADMDQIMIQQRIQYLERLIADKKSALKKAPAGNIRVDVRGDQAYFDYYRPGAFSDKRHLRTSDTRDMQSKMSILLWEKHAAI